MSLITLTQIIETSSNVTLSAVQGKIQRVVNTGSSVITVTMTGGGAKSLAPGLFMDCWYNGYWRATDGTLPTSYLGNILINGGFDIWQRNTSFSGGSQYSADRWLTHLGQVNESITASRNTDVPSNGLTAYSIKIYAPSGSYNSIQQRIESNITKKLNGKTVTLSFWLKCAESSPSVKIETDVPTNADNYSSYSSTTIGSISTAPTTWTQYSFTFTVNSSMAARGFNISISRLNTTNNTMYITQCMLNEGLIAQPFTPFGGSYISDYQACLRYFEKTYELATYIGYPYSIDAEFNGKVSFSSYSFQDNTFKIFPKRISEYTVVFYAPDGTANAIRQHAVTNLSFPSSYATNKTQTSFGVNAANTLVPNALYWMHYVIDAEIY